MADVTVKRLEEFETIFGGGFRRVRAGLGVSSFGISVMDFPPGFDRYPAHDHGPDGQEEVYTVLAGKATLSVGEANYQLEPGVFARVGPQETRRLATSDEGARVLAIGASPGQIYLPPEFTEEGQPDPISG